MHDSQRTDTEPFFATAEVQPTDWERGTHKGFEWERWVILRVPVLVVDFFAAVAGTAGRTCDNVSGG